MFINLENINKDRITYTGWDGRRHYTPQAARILVAIHPDYTLENPDLRNDVYRDIYSKFDDQGHFAGELGSALWPSLLMAKDEYLRYVMDQKKFSSIWYMINPLYMAGEYPFATVGALTLGPIGMGIGYFGSTFLRTSQEIKYDKRKFKDAASKIQEYLFSPLDRAGIDVPNEVKTFGQIIVGYRVCKHGQRMNILQKIFHSMKTGAKVMGVMPTSVSPVEGYSVSGVCSAGVNLKRAVAVLLQSRMCTTLKHLMIGWMIIINVMGFGNVLQPTHQT